MAVFEVNFMADTLNRTVPVMVILPTDKKYLSETEKREEGKPYKTLYLLHGVLGNCTNWLTNTRIKRWAEAQELAVVMPSGENSFYVDQPWNMNYYGAFIGRELVEFTRKTFPLSHRREDTYIGGLSMGGYGAVRNGLKYSDTFGAVVSLSGAFIVDETLPQADDSSPLFFQRRQYLMSCFGNDLEAAVHSDVNPCELAMDIKKRGGVFPDIYMACGESDPLMEKNIRFSDYLKKIGVRHTFEKGEGAHEWDFWDRYLKKALEWLPLERTGEGENSGNTGLK